MMLKQYILLVLLSILTVTIQADEQQDVETIKEDLETVKDDEFILEANNTFEDPWYGQEKIYGLMIDLQLKENSLQTNIELLESQNKKFDVIKQKKEELVNSHDNETQIEAFNASYTMMEKDIEQLEQLIAKEQKEYIEINNSIRDEDPGLTEPDVDLIKQLLLAEKNFFLQPKILPTSHLESFVMFSSQLEEQISQWQLVQVKESSKLLETVGEEHQWYANRLLSDLEVIQTYQKFKAFIDEVIIVPWVQFGDDFIVDSWLLYEAEVWYKYEALEALASQADTLAAMTQDNDVEYIKLSILSNYYLDESDKLSALLEDIQKVDDKKKADQSLQRLKDMQDDYTETGYIRKIIHSKHLSLNQQRLVYVCIGITLFVILATVLFFAFLKYRDMKMSQDQMAMSGQIIQQMRQPLRKDGHVQLPNQTDISCTVPDLFESETDVIVGDNLEVDLDKKAARQKIIKEKKEKALKDKELIELDKEKEIESDRKDQKDQEIVQEKKDQEDKEVEKEENDEDLDKEKKIEIDSEKKD